MKADTYKLKDFSSFTKDIINVSGEKINNCYQCRKCTAGCPITFAMDILPHQIIKYIQLGFEEKVLTSKTIWLCAACETCGTRCPNEIDLAAMMDALRQRALATQYRNRIGEKGTSVFHQEFLSSVKSNGRVYEAMMMAKSRMRSGHFLTYLLRGDWIADIKLFIPMLLKGKMGMLPHRIRNRKEIKKLFKKFAIGRKV
ncbi:MAG: 4Fe-4S dicluster domain-containing protein [Spirochaetes bacterium]|nr:4Fe-4S dicluster domain-containing protein [Spirochaetota bacterium]